MPLTINFFCRTVKAFVLDETVIQSKIAFLDKNLSLAGDMKAAAALKKIFCRSHCKFDYTILWKLFTNVDQNANVIEKYKEHASIIVIKNAFSCQLISFEAVRVKSIQIRSYFWSVFFCIRTEYGNLRCKSPYLVQILEHKDQK